MTGDSLLWIFMAIGMVWCFICFCLASASVLFLAYVGFKVLVRSANGSPDEIVVRILPWVWKKEEEPSI